MTENPSSSTPVREQRAAKVSSRLLVRIPCEAGLHRTVCLCRITDGPSWTQAAALWVNATVLSRALCFPTAFIQVFMEIWHRPSPYFPALRKLLGTPITSSDQRRIGSFPNFISIRLSPMPWLAIERFPSAPAGVHLGFSCPPSPSHTFFFQTFASTSSGRSKSWGQPPDEWARQCKRRHLKSESR